MAYIDDVVKAIQTAGRPHINVDDTLDIMRFVDGCMRSSASGQPVSSRG